MAAEPTEGALTRLGFRFGLSGAHAARTIMVGDLRILLASLPTEAEFLDYKRTVVDENILSKPTKKSRELAFRHLAGLYALDLANPIFRALRRLWDIEGAAQPLLAMTMALARDPLLQSTQSVFVDKPIGTAVTRQEVEDRLMLRDPDRFSAASLKSFAQNIAGSWTAAGVLTGRVRKIRAHPVVRPANITFCLFLAFLGGRSGPRLFSSDWIRLLGCDPDEVESLVASASHRGLLVYMNAGGIKEVRFPGYLTPKEESLRQEIPHVI